MDAPDGRPWGPALASAPTGDGRRSAGAGMVEDRLAEMGLALPEAAAPLAAYVPFMRAGDLLHVSGQV